MSTAQRLFSVSLVDPISDEIDQHLGYFAEKFARSFVKEWEKRTGKMPNESRLIKATLANLTIEETDAPLRAKRKNRNGE